MRGHAAPPHQKYIEYPVSPPRGRVFLCRDTKGLQYSCSINKKGHPIEKPPLVPVIEKETPTKYYFHGMAQVFLHSLVVSILQLNKNQFPFQNMGNFHLQACLGRSLS